MCYGGCNCGRCNGPKSGTSEQTETECKHFDLELIEEDEMGFLSYKCVNCSKYLVVQPGDFRIFFNQMDGN